MTDTELEWRFIRARLIGHGMLLSEKLQEGILTQQLIDSRKLLNSLQWHVNMDESSASGELVIDFYLYNRFQENGVAEDPLKKYSYSGICECQDFRKKKPWYKKTAYGSLMKAGRR